MKTALFIGRFQPFHNAHLQDIKDILKTHDKVIIGVGSSQESRTSKNPFSYEERKEMIDRALREAHIKEFLIIPIPDINNDDAWVEHVESIMGVEYDCIFSGNDLVLKLFSESKKKVQRIKLIENVSATMVRKLRDNEKAWEHLVPDQVARYIKTINFKKQS